jgi:hypothetical protein
MTLWVSAATLAVALSPGGNDPPWIAHDGVECVVAERFPRIEARIEGAVARARVLFRGAGAEEWYEVAMKLEGGAWVGVLPQPKRTLNAFDYYIDVIDSAMGMSRTPEFHPIVGVGAGGCPGRRVTGALASAAIHVQAPVGAPLVPAGFANAGVVGGVAGGSVTSGSEAGAAGAGSSKGLMLGLIGGGAAAAGIAAAAGGGGGSGPTSPPASGTPSPSTTPAPTPAPTPTPAPAPTPSPSPGAGLTGRWTGTLNVTDTIGSPGCGVLVASATLDLTQNGNALSGTMSVTVISNGSAPKCAPPGTTGSGPLSNGSASGATVQFSTSIASPSQPDPVAIVFSGSATGTTPGSVLSGAVQARPAGDPGPSPGTLSVTKQ